MAKGNNSKSGKGLKAFATLLLLIAIGCIGAGVYLSMGQTPKKTEKQKQEDAAPTKTVDGVELDISGPEVVGLYEKLYFIDVSAPGVDEAIKDFYETKTEINDDLKLYVALMSNDKVRSFEAGQTVTVPTSELEATITNAFETARTDNYKTMYLGGGKTAAYDEGSKSYTISLVGETPDESRYYGELYSAAKKDGNIILTVKSYYASLEQGTEGPIYKIYKDSTKQESISDQEFNELPSVMTLATDNMNSYEFVFTDADGTYKLSSFQKKAK